ncbi:CcdB family protein [Caulobacter endophyticus]|uniref:CcdB family protein n=1 Tax=Caulobacter endophyticus TaxID=2172652 RepID=UPI0024107811|nr:CcdB family protein [Caulobacter endophyticus]MDG2531925.1 CcdB family protein [Caulobacter endophyticus]
MRQFDVYRNPVPAARGVAPFLAILSSHHLHGLTEVVVAPVVNDVQSAIADLEIPVVVEDQALTLVVSELFSLDAHQLRQRIASLAAHEDAIRRALDRLFTGF